MTWWTLWTWWPTSQPYRTEFLLLLCNVFYPPPCNCATKQARRAKRVAEGHQLEIGAQRAPRFLVDDKLLLKISSFTEKSEKSAPWAFCFIYKFALLPTSVHLLMATTTFSISPFAQVQQKVHLLHVKYRHPSSKTFDNQPI